MPEGLESRPPSKLGEYEPPIDQVPAMGSPVSAMAMTASAAANSFPRLYACPSPVTAAKCQDMQHLMVSDLLWAMVAMPLLGRKPWFAAAFRPGHRPRLSLLPGAIN